MSETILIWYDGSPDAERAIDAAGALLVPGRAVVVVVTDQVKPKEA